MSYTYPGHQAPQPPPQQPKQGMSTGKKIALFGCLPITLVGLLVVGGCAVLVGGAANEVDKAVKADEAEDKRAAKEDVKLESCKIENTVIGKDVKATVKITNNGDKRANYYVEGELVDQNGNKVDSLLATVEKLEPGKSSTQPFGGLITSDQLEGVSKGTCKIQKVTRDEWLAN